MILNEGNIAFEIGTKPPLCGHNTSGFNKEHRCFMRCSTDSLPFSAILCKLAHEQEQRDTSALGKN
jgi:hypothetical protein